jgi:hypothetical protein
MKVQYHLKNLTLYFLIFLLGVTTLFAAPGVKTTNYYLGVLANGYPHSLVISEFQYANAEVVNINDNLVIFGINGNTKLTTFLKNLPFLQDVYVDVESLKGNISLNTNPLAREFLFLLQSNKTQPENPPHLKDMSLQESPSSTVNTKGSVDDSGSPLAKGSLGKKPGQENSQNNMAVIDKLNREKAEKTKKNRANPGAVK